MSATTLASRAMLACIPWKLVTQDMPKKVVLIGAPHTSYFDGLLMAICLWSTGRRYRFLVKDQIAEIPVFGSFVKACGGIPVERDHPHGLVGQAVEWFESEDDLILCLAPKGTRSKKEYWKSGFYRIAQGAGVPLQLGFIDGATKTFGWGPTYELTGDVRRDMEVIRAFYKGKTGVRPELASVPRLRMEDEAVTAQA